MDATTKHLLGAIALAFASICIAAPGNDQASVPPSAEEQAALPGETLPLVTLEERLKDTKAIPPLKKFALKGELDQLLASFRVAHAGGSPALIALREPYDKLILKIRAMLTRDPKLARDIVASKEAIWDALVDRTRFARLD